MAAPGLPHHLTVLSQVVVGHTVNGLAVSDASQIIGITDNMAALGGFGQLPYGAAGGLDLRHRGQMFERLLVRIIRNYIFMF